MYIEAILARILMCPEYDLLVSISYEKVMAYITKS